MKKITVEVTDEELKFLNKIREEAAAREAARKAEEEAAKAKETLEQRFEQARLQAKQGC